MVCFALIPPSLTIVPALVLTVMSLQVDKMPRYDSCQFRTPVDVDRSDRRTASIT